MVLLLQGRGYNLRRGVHFWDGGTSACSHEGGTVAVPLVPVGWVHTLQSVGPTKLNARSYEVVLAPRAAGRAEVRSTTP